MKGALALRKAVQTTRLDTSSSNITTAAWVQLVASTTFGASALEIINPSGSTIRLALGAVGLEVDIPYTVPPGGSGVLVCHPIPAGSRISARAVDSTMNSGYFVINLLG